jgi:hypothetical protein
LFVVFMEWFGFCEVGHRSGPFAVVIVFFVIESEINIVEVVVVVVVVVIVVVIVVVVVVFVVVVVAVVVAYCGGDSRSRG